MNKLNQEPKNANKNITADWKGKFPEYDRYRDMWLLKRSGPIVIGIYLEQKRDHSVYLPCSHIHNLTVSFPVVSLTLKQPLLDSRENPNQIKINIHKNVYNEAADRLASQALIPLSGTISLGLILNAYYKFPDSHPSRNTFRFYEDIISILVWSGNELSTTRSKLEIFKAELVAQPNIFSPENLTLEQWYEKMLLIIEQPQLVHQTLAVESERLKLNKLPIYDLSS